MIIELVTVLQQSNMVENERRQELRKLCRKFRGFENELLKSDGIKQQMREKQTFSLGNYYQLVYAP